MINARFHPIAIWPHGSTPGHRRRSRYTFKAGWEDTLILLERELRLLKADNIVIGCGLRWQDIRNDGWPRANAQTPSHPGVELSFDMPDRSRKPGLHMWVRPVYATDVCVLWEHNVRAIALGLEALRAVDRHGITRRGEQYAGFWALEPATSEPSVDRGRELIGTHGGVREALRATHPDTGGDEADFKAVIAAKEMGA